MRRSLGIILALGLLLCSQVNAMQAPQREEVIIPGRSVAQLRLGDPVPANREFWAKRQISWTAEKGNLVRIEVRSPQYLLEGSWIGVDRSTLDDVLRFYGSATSTREQGRDLVVRYDLYGLEFAIGRSKNRVKLIAVFPPQERKLNKELFKQQLQQYWQKK
jgi:hypothetical protein